jgi:N-acetylglucosaminyl-diphospho-decaprenol L-rhamnosyltransferase
MAPILPELEFETRVLTIRPMPAPVAVVVVSWNTRELLRRCLASLQEDADSGRAAVCVLDNASSDGSAAMVRGDFPWVELIASAENLGFGPAVNLVAARTDTPWLAIANADTELLPGALQRMLSCGEAHPDAAIIAPRLIEATGGTQHSVHPFPTLPLTLAFNLGVARPWGDRLALEGSWDPERPRTVDWALGAFLAVRRTAWDQIGGFDPGQWMYAEDLDLGWRAARAGWTTRYEPGAAVRHVGGAATEQAWGAATRDRWMASTYGWMLRRRGPVVTRTYALIGTGGAAARMLALTPHALRSPEHRARRAEMRAWYRLHRAALLSSSARLAGQR